VFEWDEQKRRQILTERGIDLLEVLALFAAPERIEFEDVRKDYGERRFVLLCPLDGRLLHVTYTMRHGNRRIISARKANKREQRIYERYRNANQSRPHY
jgi:uncharacterized DUF497 family protein